MNNAGLAIGDPNVPFTDVVDALSLESHPEVHTIGRFVVMFHRMEVAAL